MQWLRNKDGLSGKTRDDYAATIRRDIAVHIGNVKLRLVTSALLREFFTTLREERKLSYNSQRLVYNVLAQALDIAEADGLLPSNPAKARDVRPRNTSEEAAKSLPAFTREEAGRYLAAATDGQNRAGEVLALLLLTGLRKGEALYLRWMSVSLQTARPTLEVKGTRSQSGGEVYENEKGKTDKAKRTLPLLPETTALFRAIRQRKTEENEMFGVADSPYVFSGMHNGTAYRPDSLTRVHVAIRSRAGLDERPLNIHALRHTYASLMAAQGMRIEVLSFLLGHSDPSFTLRRYRHLYPEEIQGMSLDFSAQVSS